MKNPKLNPNPNKFMFAWSDYAKGKLTFHAVAEDLKIYSTTNWDTFFAKTNLYCQRKRNFTDGFLTKDEEARIHTHERYMFNFIIKKNRIEIVSEEEITYYDIESEPEEIIVPKFVNH